MRRSVSSRPSGASCCTCGASGVGTGAGDPTATGAKRSASAPVSSYSSKRTVRRTAELGRKISGRRFATSYLAGGMTSVVPAGTSDSVRSLMSAICFHESAVP